MPLVVVACEWCFSQPVLLGEDFMDSCIFLKRERGFTVKLIFGLKLDIQLVQFYLPRPSIAH